MPLTRAHIVGHNNLTPGQAGLANEAIMATFEAIFASFLLRTFGPAIYNAVGYAIAEDNDNALVQVQPGLHKAGQ